MKNFILRRNFYNRPTPKVAKELLGKFIVRKIGKKKLVGKIVEVEAYHGLKDLASHASRGKTERNAVMFGHAGYIYVYMIYGMYYCFNIVTGDHGYPAAVLIRAVEPVFAEASAAARILADKSAGKPTEKKFSTNGPGKFCRAFKIDKSLNGADVTKSKMLWLEDRGGKIKKADIISAKRIGVDYAKEYKDKLWRFYIKGNGFEFKK